MTFVSQKSKRGFSKQNPGRQNGAQNPAAVSAKAELLELSGGFENLLAQPLVMPLGKTMTTFVSMGQIPWPGYMSPNTELRDAGLVGTFAPEMAKNLHGDASVQDDENPVGTFNDVFQLKAPSKLVTEAEKTLVQRCMEQFVKWLPPKHIDKRCRDKHYVVSRRAAVAAYLMNYNTLRRMLIPGGEITCSKEGIYCQWLVPAWMLFGEEAARR